MGLFDKIFGGKPQHSPLPDDSEAARQLGRFQDHLNTFIGQTKDNLEAVPSDQEVYIFIGSPPKRFGIVWIDATGKLNNLKTLASEKGVSPTRLQNLVGELSKVYQAGNSTIRYTAELGGRQLTVTPSADLAANIRRVISAATSG